VAVRNIVWHLEPIELHLGSRKTSRVFNRSQVSFWVSIQAPKGPDADDQLRAPRQKPVRPAAISKHRPTQSGWAFGLLGFEKAIMSAVVIVVNCMNLIRYFGSGSVWAAASVALCWEQAAGVTGRWAGEDDPPAAESTEPPENTSWNGSVMPRDVMHVARCTSAAGITGLVRGAAPCGTGDWSQALKELPGPWTKFQRDNSYC